MEEESPAVPAVFVARSTLQLLFVWLLEPLPIFFPYGRATGWILDVALYLASTRGKIILLAGSGTHNFRSQYIGEN